MEDMLENVRKAEEEALKAQKMLEKTFESIKPLIPDTPQLILPSFDFAETKDWVIGPPSEIVREENQWKRHAEMLRVLDRLLKSQRSLLQETRSAQKYVVIGLILSGLAAIFAGLSLVR